MRTRITTTKHTQQNNIHQKHTHAKQMSTATHQQQRYSNTHKETTTTTYAKQNTITIANNKNKPTKTHTQKHKKGNTHNMNTQ